MATARDSPTSLARGNSLYSSFLAIQRLTLKYVSTGVQTDPEGFLDQFKHLEACFSNILRREMHTTMTALAPAGKPG